MDITPARSHTAAVYDRLRRDIIKALFLPGEKLLIAGLCARYNVGLSPVREALNRLSRDGLVTHSEQRGFFVAPFSSDQLDELTKTRSWLNEIGLRESIKRGDDAWEERVVLAYHRLAKLPRHERGPSGQVTDAWESAHREFHASLVAGCGSAWLTRYCEQLFDAAERYRNLSRLLPNKLSTRSKDEHRAIMEAAVARDALTAVKLLNEHFERTARLVRSALRVGSSRPLALRSPA